MFKKIKTIIPVLFLTAILLLPCLALATDSPADKLMNVGEDSGYNTDARETSIENTVGGIIGVALTLLGIIFLALFVYAGFMWMIAAGNEDKVTTAKNTMRRAIIGLIIVVAAYAISQFVILAILS